MVFRLLALVIGATVLPALILGTLVIRSGQVSLERDVAHRNRELARRGAEKVDAFIANTLDHMRLLVMLSELDRLDAEDARTTLSLFLSFLQDVTAVTLVDAQGRERIRLSQGALYTSRDLASRSGSPAFETARTGREYIGPVTTSPHGEPVVALALPIQNLFEGRVTGVFVAEVSLKRLWDEVLSFRVGTTGYVYLVGPEGKLIAHPDFSLVLAGKDMRGFAAVRHFLRGSAQLSSAWAGAYPNHQGREVLGVFAQSAKLRWGVIVEQPLSEALAHVQQVKVETAVMLVNTLAVAILLGALAARQVTRSIRGLVGGAAAVGAGDFDHTIAIRGHDELAEVAAAFNGMTANVRRNFQRLRTLLEGTTHLVRATGREEILRLAVEETQGVVEDARCAVLFLADAWDGSGPARAEIWHKRGRADATMVLQPREEHAVFHALSSGTVAVIRAGMLLLPTEIGGDAEAPALVVPFPAGHHAQGALLVVRSVGHEEFGETQVMLCQTIANHLGIALQLREAHEHLMQSEKFRTVGEIAAGVAHNFNNVLAAILGWAQLLQARPGQAEVSQGLPLIEQAALDGARIVRRLQDSTRLRPAVSFAPVALTQVVQDALELTRPRWKDAAELRGAPIAVEAALGELPAVLGDAAELREVATNVILNAVDAMPSGGRLRIEGAASQGWVTLSFRDTGTGMTEDVRRRIFDPFFSTKETLGTGLGMTVSHAIVKRHGGEILVDSVVGSGTTLSVRLPVTRTLAVRSPGAAETPSACASRRILVADDDGYIRGVLREFLTSLGHRVEAVDSGQQAMERFAPGAFDLVITDLGMEVSGREVARTIKARSPSTPVIVVTGWTANLDEDELRQAGVDLVLTKPFQLREVRDVVDRFSARPTGSSA